MTDTDLINMCHLYGKIMSTKAIIDQNTMKCKGYYYPFSKAILPVIKTVPHATQYGTTVTVPDVQNTILLAESLL